MRLLSSIVKGFQGFAPIVGLAFVLSASAQAGQFELGVLIQAGVAGAGDWEIAAGNNVGAPASTASLANQWVNGAPRAMQMEYLKASNTVNVRIYDGATATGSFTQASFQPTNGAAVAADAIWTLPTSSFFVSANAPIFASSITLSNLALSGVSGAISIIQPIQQTTLSATHSFLGGTSTVSQSQEVVFMADNTGSWRLNGTVTMTGMGQFFGATGNDLTFALGASAVDAVPEPGTWSLMLVGGALILGGSRRKKARNRPVRP